MAEQEQDQIISSWLMQETEDVCDLLTVDDTPLLESPSHNDCTFYFEGNTSSPESPPSYSSTPELPEMEGTFIHVETPPPLFGDQIDEAILFGNSFTVNPDVLPELERILASVEGISSSPPSAFSPSSCISSPSHSAPPSPSDEANADSKRNSKKRKGDDGKELKGSDILLPRDQLLVMTSAEIESYVSNLKSVRNLTGAEEKELKKQRRLVKNREYASQSRSRKKLFVDELEKTIEDLRAENTSLLAQNTSLSAQVTSLTEENKGLRRKITTIATTIKKSSTSHTHSGASTPLSGSASGILTRLTTVGGTRQGASKTVGVCVLAMMFMVLSVGMLKDPRVDLFPARTSSHISTDDVTSTQGDYYVHYGGGRVLLEDGDFEEVLHAAPTSPPIGLTHRAPTLKNTRTPSPTTPTTPTEPTTTTPTTTTPEPTTTADSPTTTLKATPSTTPPTTHTIPTATPPTPTTAVSEGSTRMDDAYMCGDVITYAPANFTIFHTFSHNIFSCTAPVVAVS